MTLNNDQCLSMHNVECKNLLFAQQINTYHSSVRLHESKVMSVVSTGCTNKKIPLEKNSVFQPQEY